MTRRVRFTSLGAGAALVFGLAVAPVFAADPPAGGAAAPSAVAAAPQPQPGTPREVLPDLGQIGAQVSVLVGLSTNPFAADRGILTGGYIDLPVFRAGSGKVSYQVAIINHMASTDVRITSPLSAVGDLLAADGLGNTLTSKVLSSLKNMPAKEDLDLLVVQPFGLKYTVLSADHMRIRPYLLGGFGVYVTIAEENPNLTVDPRLEGAFIGGIAPEAPELTARGLPEGQGDIRMGGNVGGGLEVRVAARASLGAEYRFHKLHGTANTTFSTFSAKLAFHF